MTGVDVLGGNLHVAEEHLQVIAVRPGRAGTAAALDADVLGEPI
jgi:hypothetical protein